MSCIRTTSICQPRQRCVRRAPTYKNSASLRFTGVRFRTISSPQYEIKVQNWRVAINLDHDLCQDHYKKLQRLLSLRTLWAFPSLNKKESLSDIIDNYKTHHVSHFYHLQRLSTAYFTETTLHCFGWCNWSRNSMNSNTVLFLPVLQWQTQAVQQTLHQCQLVVLP